MNIKKKLEFLTDVHPRRVKHDSFIYGLCLGGSVVLITLMGVKISCLLLGLGLAVCAKYAHSRIERA